MKHITAFLTITVIIFSSMIHTQGEPPASYKQGKETTTQAAEEDPGPDPTSPRQVKTSLGEFKLTAYCPCEKCCGKWALNRPGGKVITASGAEAKAGITVAADTSVLPFGSVIIIDGHEYTVQDRGGAVKGKVIDIYFNDHDEALRFGVRHKEVFIKELEHD